MKNKKINKNFKLISKDERKLYAFISSFFTIIGFVVALILWKDDKYIMFYAKQGLILFIFQAFLFVLKPILFFLNYIFWVFWLILWVITWINALSGETRKTFLIGDLAEKFKI